MVYSAAWGKLIHEKNQKSKISWHCPFNSMHCDLLINRVSEFSPATDACFPLADMICKIERQLQEVAN